MNIPVTQPREGLSQYLQPEVRCIQLVAIGRPLGIVVSVALRSKQGTSGENHVKQCHNSTQWKVKVMRVRVLMVIYGGTIPSHQFNKAPG